MREEQLLLVVCSGHTGSTRRLVDAFITGTQADGIDGVTVRLLEPLDAGVDDVMAAHAIVLAAPENFGLINGLMKDFIERIYYPCLDVTIGKPYVLIVKGRDDGRGAIRTTEKILVGLKWKAVLPPLRVVGEITGSDLADAQELGATLAGGLMMDIW